MRRVMLTVPPAPGIRPRLSSGRPSTAVGMRLHPSAVRGHLQPAAQHLAVHLGTAVAAETGGQLVEHQRRAVPGAGEVRAGRVGERAELGEIAAAAERRAVAGQHHLGDRRVETRDLERLEQCGAHVGGERVVPLWPVEPDMQTVPVAVGLHGIGDVGHGGGPAFGQPARELRPRLQRRVRQRFGDDAGAGGSGRIDRAQHVVADGCRLRPALASFGEFGERIGNRRDRDQPGGRRSRLRSA